MLRLALPTLDDAIQTAVAARLHGGVVVPQAAAQIGLWLDTHHAYGSNSLCDASDPLASIAADLSAGRSACVATSLVSTPQQLNELLHAARSGDARLLVVNPELFRPSRQLLTDQLARGLFGSVGLVRIHIWDTAGPAVLAPHANIDNLGFRFPARLHEAVDAALCLLDSAPNCVSATANCDENTTVGRAPGDNLLIHLGFSSGAMALIDWALLPAGATEYQALSVIAAHGAVYADDESNYQHGLQANGVEAWRANEQLRTLVNLAQFALSSCEGERDEAAHVAQWRRTQATIADVTRALASGDSVCGPGM